MKRFYSLTKRLFLPALVTAILSGCISDQYTETPSAEEGMYLLVELKVPGVSAPAVRSLAEPEEYYIDKLDVLVFNGTGDNETFAYRTHGIPNDAGTYKVKIQEGETGATYRFVFLANLNDEVTAALTTDFTSKTKAEVLEAITFDAWTGGTPWNTSTTPPRYLPMWGESVVTYVSDSPKQQSLGVIEMLRAVARVDILFNPTPESTAEDPKATGFDIFKVKSVTMYNVSSTGAVAPSADNWEHITDPVITLKATEPSVPLSAEGKMIEYFKYTDEPKNQFVREIYIAESANTTGTGVNKANIDEADMMTYLIISGSYNGGLPTWYRLDFINDATTNLRWDILRNHRYTFNITAVNGPGYSSKTEAQSSLPMNLTHNIVAWDEGTINDVVFDKQYMLGVSQRVYDLAMDGYNDTDTDNQLTITTNYPDGWEIVSYIDNDTKLRAEWLRVAEGDKSSGTTTTTVTKTIPLILDPNSAAGASDRSATILIKAGNLTIDVQVNQSQIPNLGLTVKDKDGKEISELVFHNGTSATQTFRVKWAPASAAVDINSTPMSGGEFKFDNESPDKPGTVLTSINDGSGNKLFTILPLTITPDELIDNPFMERMSKVDFTVTNGLSYMSKSIYLRQVNYALIASGYDDTFLMDGSQHSFTVQSNDAWTAAITSTSHSNLAILNVTSGNGDPSTGETIKFTLADDINGPSAGSIGSGAFNITFTSVNGKFTLQTYTVNCVSGTVWAGSNIYWSGTTLTFDDYSSAGSSPKETHQGVYFKWGSLWGISPSGDWANNSAVVYKPNTPPNTGYIADKTANWSDIPYLTVDVTADRNQSYLSENHATNIAGGKGDICKYLTEQAGGKLHGKKWRLPTSNEFSSVAEPSSTSLTSSNNTDYKWVPTSWTGTVMASADGTAKFPNGVRKSKAVGTPFFPAAGYRATNGVVGVVGTSGCYWSASPSSADDGGGYSLEFGSGAVYPSVAASVAEGMSVRCVVE